MKSCPSCGGPIAYCLHCHRWHCDDPECEETPIACATLVQSS